MTANSEERRYLECEDKMRNVSFSTTIASDNFLVRAKNTSTYVINNGSGSIFASS